MRRGHYRLGTIVLFALLLIIAVPRPLGFR